MAAPWKHYWNKPGVADGFRVWDPDHPQYEETQPSYIDDIIIEFIPEYDKILDAGCGIGRYAKLLKSRGRMGEYHGFDYSVEMIKIAKEVCEDDFNFCQGDVEYIEKIEELPPLDSFDVIIMIALLRHLPMLKAMRVLKKVCEFDKPVVFTAFIGSERPDEQFTHKGLIVKKEGIFGLGAEDNPVIDRPFSFRQIFVAIGKRRIEMKPIDSRLDYAVGKTGLGQRYLFKVYPRENPHYVEAFYNLFETYDIKSILDVGCGFGRTYPRTGRGREYVGIDVDADKIAVAKKRFPEATWIFENFLNYQTDQVFDALWCFCFFCIIKDITTLKRIIYKMTKIGRRLFLVDSHVLNWELELRNAGWELEHKEHVWGPSTFTEIWKNTKLT